MKQNVRRTGARAALLAAHRAPLVSLLHHAAQAAPGRGMVACVLALAEPLGYAIAASLQQRAHDIDPDGPLRAAVAGTGPRTPVLLAVVARRALGELLDGVAPALQGIATSLQAPRARGHTGLVAAAGSAVFFPLREVSTKN